MPLARERSRIDDASADLETKGIALRVAANANTRVVDRDGVAVPPEVESALALVL